jgi:hypothetical protein
MNTPYRLTPVLKHKFRMAHVWLSPFHPTSIIMFKHFIKIAYRNLIRRKVYSFINVTGLAVGMACCLLITYYVQHELSFDRYHKNFDRIYRVTHAFRSSQEGEVLPPPTPEQFQVWGCAPIGPAIAADFPAIDKVAQFSSPVDLLLQNGNTRIQEKQPVIHGFNCIRHILLENAPGKSSYCAYCT